MLTTEDARQQLLMAKRLGIEELEFTGGEVTLRRDFVDLVSYAKKELGFRVVSMITNGIRLSRKPYMAALAAAGMDDILFSVHGHDANTHDSILKVPRSFHRVMEAINNAHALGLRVRTNTVVCKMNYRNISAIFAVLVAKKIDNINLVMFNPVLQAEKMDITKDVYVSYADAGREIIRGIRDHEHHLPHLNIRYMPFCFLPGYEKYVTNLDQMTFDPDEWDNYVSFRMRKGAVVAWACVVPGILSIPYLRIAMRYGIRGLRTAGMSRFYVLKDRVKAAGCRQCAYEKVCDYLYREYYDIYGNEHVKPISGPKINDPAWIMNAAKFRRPGELPFKVPRMAVTERASASDES